ncbi:MAG: enolase C-terminal domain-like protein [Solirubrobacterales bacterium]
MNVERFELFPLRLGLRHAFTTAAGAVEHRDLAVLRLTDSEGNVGFGEVTPYPHPRFDGLRDLVDAIELQARPRLSGCEMTQTAYIMDELGSRLPAPALAAVDTALLDLQAHQLGVPLAELFALPARASVEVNATIAGGSIDQSTALALAAVEAGFKTLKIKVGLPDDIERVEAIREAVGWETRLRIDANGAWFSAEAVGRIGELTSLGLELIEQPVAADDLLGMHRVRDSVLVPVVADEGVRDAADLREYVRENACDGVAIKLSQVGGPARATVLADKVLSAGLFCYVTSTLDGPVGLAAGLHFAATRAEIDLACGLATASALADTYGSGLPDVVDGSMTIGTAPGLGIELDDGALSEHALELTD